MVERKLTWVVDVTSQRAKGSIQAIDKQFDSLKGNMDKTSKHLKDMGSSMTARKFTAVVAGTAIAGVKAVSDFDDGLSQVKAKTQATTEDMNKMRAMALDLGKGARGPSEIVDAMDILGSAGKSTNEILAMTPDLTTLMSAGAVDADTSARALTGTMAQFNMEADQSGRIVDVFAKGASSSKTNVSELTSALSMAGGELANMNMDIGKATALAGVMADANIEGSRAGTTMSAMARDIKANSKAFESMGISVYDANGQMQDMGSTLKDLERALQGKTDAQRDAMLADLFTGQSLRGVNAFLAQGSEKYQELEKAMYNAKGESARMADDMEDNIGGAFRKLKNSGKVFLIEFGEVFKDDVQGWATGLSNLAGKVADVDKDTMKLIGTGALFLAGVGPITSAIGGIIGGLSSVLGVLTGITGLVMANPWILGATAAVVGGKKLYDYGIKKRDERLDDMRKGKAKTINIKPMPADTHVMGSHKDGLNTVPFDGYVAELHEDEEVLTADDPRNINNNKVPGQNISVSMPINIAVEGNATEDTALEVGKETRRVVRNELDIFFQKLNVQLGVRRLINRDKVKLGELVFDVIVEEEIDDMSEITNKPIEQGGTVSDHVQKQPTYLNLQGAYTGTDAPEQLQKLLKMYYGGKPYKYVGRNAYDNVVIKKLRRRHNRDNRLGFDFEMTLQRVDIAKAETFEVKASPPKAKPKPSNNAPKQSKSSQAKTNTQVKKTTTQGRQQPKSKYVAEVRQRSSVAHRVKWGDIKKPGDTVAVMLKAHNFNQIKGKKKKGLVGVKKLSINKDLIPYSFEIELNDKIYTMVVKYNERFDFFTIDVYLDDEIVMYGEKITLGEPLFLPVMYKDMPIIAPFDFAYNATRVTFENLDDTVELIFIPDDEVGAYDEILE